MNPRAAPPPADASRIELPEPALDRLPALTRSLAASAAEHDRTGGFPHPGIALVHEAGLLTSTVHRRYGGPGLGLAGGVRVLQALGRGDPSVALITAMTLFTHAAQGAVPSWSATAYDALLADSTRGPALVNSLRVEPDLGTPARGGVPATTARRVTDGWLLSGHKIYSTGAVALSRMVVHARTAGDPPQVGGFVVLGGSAGIRVEPTWDHLGLRASRSDDVFFTDVPVAPDQVVGLADPGAPAGGVTPSVALWNTLGLTAIYLGVARAAFGWLTGFLHERVPSALGAPLASLPRFQTAVGELDVELTAAEDLIVGLAARHDAGEEELAARASAAKLVGTRTAIDTVARAVALTGNNGLTRANPLERHLRDVLCARVHTPQDDAITAMLGRAALDR